MDYRDCSYLNGTYFVDEGTRGGLKKDFSGVWSKPVGKVKRPKFFFNNKSNALWGRRLKPFGDSLIICGYDEIKIVGVKYDCKSGKVRSIKKEDISNEAIIDFITIGNKGIAFITQSNKLAVFDNIRKKIIKVKSLKGEDMNYSLAICDKNEYLFIHQKDKRTWKSSGIIVLKLSTLSEVTRFDMRDLDVERLHCFSVFGNFGDFIIISALTYENNPTLLTFKYFILDNRLEELESERRELSLGNVHKFVKKNGSIVGISNGNELLEFNYLISE